LQRPGVRLAAKPAVPLKDRFFERSSVSHVARHTEPRSLYTERLCLRAPTPGDAEALYDLFADEEVMEGLGREPVSAVDDVRAMIEGMIRGWRTEGAGAVHFRDGGNRPAGGRSSRPHDLRHARLDGLDLGRRRKSCSARTRVGLDTGALGSRLRDRSSSGNPGMGI
jgi:hypothetical protein